MRLFWSGFLMTGLLLIGWTTYERRLERQLGAQEEVEALQPVSAAEDGTGFPSPYPSPR